MTNREIELSSARIVEIHERIQMVKPPKGWAWFKHTFRGVFNPIYVKPEFNLVRDIGESLDLDELEQYVFLSSFNLRVRDLIMEDFYGNIPFPFEIFGGVARKINGDKPRQEVLDQIEITKRSLFAIYQNQVEVSVDRAKRHVQSLPGFGSVLSTTFYQEEIDPGHVLKLVSSWGDTIRNSREATGYIPMETTT